MIIKKIYLIPSSNGEDLYEVDPESLTCNCPDFVYRRSSKITDDPERLCKHLKLVLEYLNKKEEEKKEYLKKLVELKNQKEEEDGEENQKSPGD